MLDQSKINRGDWVRYTGPDVLHDWEPGGKVDIPSDGVFQYAHPGPVIGVGFVDPDRSIIHVPGVTESHLGFWFRPANEQLEFVSRGDGLPPEVEATGHYMKEDEIAKGI